MSTALKQTNQHTNKQKQPRSPVSQFKSEHTISSIRKKNEKLIPAKPRSETTQMNAWKDVSQRNLAILQGFICHHLEKGLYIAPCVLRECPSELAPSRTGAYIEQIILLRFIT